jgi:TonB family protein
MGNWTVSAWPILASAALKSTLVLGVAWILSTLLRRRSAAARHMVWTASAAALVALPLLSLVLPALRVRLANHVLPSDTTLVFRTSSAAPAAVSGAATPGQPLIGPAAAAHHVPDRPLTGKDALVILWTLGLTAGLLQMLAGSAVLWRTRRRARISPDQETADGLTIRFGIGQPVQVLEAEAVMPMTFGVLRPTILLPETARTWSVERRHVVLLHELAHIARGDAGTQLLARAALALHWWNPLAWLAWREFLKERERAADDLVLSAGAVASNYAGHLLEIARTLQFKTPVSAAAVCMARRSELEGRLLSILDGQVQRGHLRRNATVLAVIAAVAIIAPLAAVRAQAQGDQDAPPSVDTAISRAAALKSHQILDEAAIGYEQLRKWAEAQQLREASLVMVEKTSGPLSNDYVAGLVKLGDLARKRFAMKEAVDYYTKALAQGDRPEVFAALINLGRANLMHTAAGPTPGADTDANLRLRTQSLTQSLAQAIGILPDPAKAMEYFKRARNVAPTNNDLGTALMWMAMVRQNQDDGEAEAESLFNSSLAASDPASAEQALTLEFYGQFLRAHHRASQADTVTARARTIRRDRIKGMGPAEVASSAVMRVGEGVSPPSLLYKVEPSYSEEARAAKYQGSVLLTVVVDVDGKAKDVDVSKGLGLGLDEQAVIAIRSWKFKPGMKEGVPVPVKATIEVNFRLM